MSESNTPRELHLKIIEEKHRMLPTIMKRVEIDCWIIFARETSTTPDSSMQFVVGSDVVLSSAFIFSLQKDNTLKKQAIVANFDADAEKSKGIWDNVIGYEKGIKAHLQEKLRSLNPQRIGLNYSIDDYSADGLTHGMYLQLQEIIPEYQNRFTSARRIVNAIRSNKSATEIGLKIFGSPTTSDQVNLKIPSVKIGPGKSQRSHTADEFIEIAEIEHGIQIYIKWLTHFNNSLNST